MKIPLIAWALCLAAASSFAGEPLPAASAPDPYNDSFTLLDTNRDGVLTFSEVFRNPKLSNNFNALDKNADGVLSPQEVQGLVALR